MPLSPPVPFAGEFAALAAAAIWACTMSVFTVYGRNVPPQVLNLYKNFVAISFLALAALVFRPSWPSDMRACGVLAISGVVGLSLGDTALFGALKRLGAQITSASQCLAPPFAALMASLFLGETLTPRELAGLTLTTAAVTALIYFGRRRGAQLAQLPRRTLLVGIALALLAALCQGAGVVLQRQALQSVDVVNGTLIRLFPAVLVLAVATASSRQKLRPQIGLLFQSRRQGWALGTAAFAGTCLGLVLLSVGAKYAKAGVAAALMSTYPVWIIPIARVALKERVTLASAVCALAAVGGIALMVL